MATEYLQRRTSNTCSKVNGSMGSKMASAGTAGKVHSSTSANSFNLKNTVLVSTDYLTKVFTSVILRRTKFTAKVCSSTQMAQFTLESGSATRSRAPKASSAGSTTSSHITETTRTISKMARVSTFMLTVASTVASGNRESKTVKDTRCFPAKR